MVNAVHKTARCRFITSYSYNFAGEPAGGSTFVTGGPYWTNTYDAIGRLTSVWTSYLNPSTSGYLINGVTYNALNEATGATLGNGLSESWGYDHEGHNTSYSAGSLYSYSSLTYNPLLTNSADSVNGNRSYTYDALNRLATSGDGTNNFSYSYDRWGNRWNQTVTKGSGPQPSYSFNTNNQSGSFTYDAAGNITNDGFHTYSYDAEGRVLKVDGGATNTYVYNSRGMRASLSGAENLFDLQGNIVSVVTPGTTTLLYNRYTVGGRLLAANSNNTTNFYHQDWLGGIRALSSLSGSLVSSCSNLPFGDGTNSCGLWYFAGLMSDSWDNLNTSATRSESPTSGRWLTPDPAGAAVMDVSNPQTWNRYAYVANNPLSFVDPSGLELKGPGQGGCDSNLMDCGSSGGSPSTPGGGNSGGVNIVGGPGFVNFSQSYDVYGYVDNFDGPTQWQQFATITFDEGAGWIGGNQWGDSFDPGNSMGCATIAKNVATTQNDIKGKGTAQALVNFASRVWPTGSYNPFAAFSTIGLNEHSGWDYKISFPSDAGVAFGNVNFGANCSQFYGKYLCLSFAGAATMINSGNHLPQGPGIPFVSYPYGKQTNNANAPSIVRGVNIGKGAPCRG
jgi:RHS repeat-associated protein